MESERAWWEVWSLHWGEGPLTVSWVSPRGSSAPERPRERVTEHHREEQQVARNGREEA